MTLTGKKTDRQLVVDCLKGNLASFEVIVRRYQRRIYFYSLRIVKDEDSAEDVTQEAFIRFFENLKKFNLNRPLQPWIYKIATNLSYDFLRREKRFVRLEWEIEAEGISILDKMIKDEEEQNIKKTLKKLPKIYHQPILGFYFQNLSYKMLAKKLALPLNTLRTRLKRGKIYLAKEFNERQ